MRGTGNELGWTVRLRVRFASHGSGLYPSPRLLPDRLIDTHVPSPDEIPAVQSFLRRAWVQAGPSALGWTGATEESMREIESETFLRNLLSDPNSKVRVAAAGTTIIGLAVLRGIALASWELGGIIVLESETGRGVGRALLEAILSDAARARARSIVVKTEVFNERARSFYRSAGFVEAARTDENIGGKPIPLVILERRLTSVSPGAPA